MPPRPSLELACDLQIPGEAGTSDIFGTNIIVEGAGGRQHFQFGGIRASAAS
jgi:hypothetical protein